MKLYSFAGACSLAPHIALHELGLEHQIIPVNLRKGEGQTPAFLALNPTGAVPVLELPDGTVLTEVLAILLYLGGRKPEMGWIPADPIRLYEKLSFIATELHKSFYPLFFRARLVSSPEAVAELSGKYKERLAIRWQRVADWLGDQDYLLGSFGPCDIYLYVVLTWWLKGIGESLDRWPSLLRFLARMEQRPAVQAALQRENLTPSLS